MSASVLIDKSRIEGFPLRSRGKVRDVYEVGENLLIVTTDRISAFDVVLPTLVPDKGAVLNQLSLYWFEKTREIVPNHLITAEVTRYPPALHRYELELENRSMLVKKLEPLPFECVVRGYLYGSGFKEYEKTGSVSGVRLPRGLKLADQLSQPLFTPATKATSGHDENVSERQMANVLGSELTQRLKDISLRIYQLGRKDAEPKGILIADTKLEFGVDPDTSELYLIDEVLTPDSSRFWPRASFEPGREQESFDKQFVREYLETLDWDKTAPGPELPEDVVEGTRARYLEAFRALTGRTEL